MEIKTKHMFTLARIIKISNSEETCKNVIKLVTERTENEEAKAEEVGAEMFSLLLNITSNEKSEAMLYSLLGELVGKTSKEISDQNIETTIADFKKVAKESDLISVFFKSMDSL